MNDFHCMNCNVLWGYEFLLKHMTKTSMKRILLHRQEVLFDREKAKLPQTQVYVRYQMEINRDIELRDELYRAFNILHEMIVRNSILISKEYRDLQTNNISKSATLERIKKLNEINEKYRNESKRLMEDANKNYMKIHKWGKDMTTEDEIKDDHIVYKCQKIGCKGFVMSDWYCGMCNNVYCKMCYNVYDIDHICNSQDIDTINVIMSTSKSCPSCGIMIHKLDGCSQIWCTNCKTTFDYDTGLIDTGIIHNPHYYQWFRENIHDTDKMSDDNSDRLIDNRQLIRHIMVAFGNDTEESMKLLRITRLIMHIYHLIETIHIPDTKNIKYNMRERINYMMDKITENDFKRKLLKKEKALKYNMNMKEIYETCLVIMNDISHKLLRKNYIHETKDIIEEFENFLQYINNEIVLLANMYTCRPRILR